MSLTRTRLLQLARTQEGTRNIEGLIALLEKYGIPLELWGKGSAKTVGNLLKEIQKGECELITSEEGLARVIHIALVDVSYQDPTTGIIYKLVQKRQIFSDGRIREQNYPVSISEKLTTEERMNYDFELAAHRGVQEELGLDPEFVNLGTGQQQLEIRDSESYPGLESQYISVIYPLALTPEQYNPEGYQEIQDDKTTYFEWINV